MVIQRPLWLCFLFVCFSSFLLYACSAQGVQLAKVSKTTESNKVNATEFVIHAEQYIASSDEVHIETFKGDEKTIRTIAGRSWLSYEVNVPVAGRYRFEVHASAPGEDASVWIEDYIDNPDGRTYNITGTVKIVKGVGSPGASTIDGSPLNKGIHKLKLHINGEEVRVDKMKFKLLKPHRASPVTMTQNMNGDDWKLAWSDEFDGNGLPDTSKWTFDLGNWGWGNSELQYYTENRLENARLENGNLIIEAHKNDLNQEWTSARLTTRGKIAFLYGRIEFRATCPPNKGNWAAGWTLGNRYVDEKSWPYCGEIDILESVGYEMDNNTGSGIAHASLHSGAYYFKLNNQPTSVLKVENMDRTFHTYAVEWSPEYIKAFVDGTEYFEFYKNSTDLQWPFDQPQNLILNLAMGGGWGGSMGMDESVNSQKFVLDYVRVYEKD